MQTIQALGCSISIRIVLSTIVLLSFVPDAAARSDYQDPNESYGSARFRPQTDGGDYHALSHNGRWYFTTTEERNIYAIYDLSNGNLWRTYSTQRDGIIAGQTVFSPDSSLVAIADGSNQVDVLSVWNGYVIGKIFGDGSYSAAAFSPNGKHLAALLGKKVGATIELWNWSNKARLAQFTFPEKMHVRIVFSTDGTKMAAIHISGAFSIWNLQTNERLLTDAIYSELSNDAIIIVDINHDFSKGIFVTSRDARLIDLRDRKTIWTRDCVKAQPSNIRLVGAGKAVAYLDDNTPRVEIIDQIDGQTRSYISGITEKPDSILVSGSGNTVVAITQSRVFVWDFVTQQMRDYCLGAGRIDHISFTKDNQFLLSTGIADGFDGIRAWNRKSSALVMHERRFKGFVAGTTGSDALFWSAHGELAWVNLATLRTTRKGYLYRGASGKWHVDANSILDRFQANLSCVRLSASGDLKNILVEYAYLSEPGSIEAGIVSIVGESGICLKQKKPNEGQISEISISQDGRNGVILMTSDFADMRRIEIIKLDTMKSVECRIPADVQATRISLSKDGRHVAALCRQDDSTDGAPEVRIWDGDSGELKKLWKPTIVASDYRLPNDIPFAISPDGSQVAVGGRNGMIEIWWTENANAFSTDASKVTAHRGGISAITYSSDGCWLATGSWDSTLLMHNVQQLVSDTIQK